LIFFLKFEVMSGLTDRMEENELNVIDNDDNDHDDDNVDSSSSKESSKSDDSVDETDSVRQKRLTLKMVNDKSTRKFTKLHEKIKRSNDKYEKEKKIAEKQRNEEKIFFQTMFSQMNENMRAVMDASVQANSSQMNQLKESVNESVNESVKSVDAKLERITERQTEQSDTLQRFELNMVDLRKAIIHDDARLSELNTRVNSISEQHALLQEQQMKEEESMKHLLDESKEQQGVNEQVWNKLKRVDSFSNFLKLRCDDIQDSLKQTSQLINEQMSKSERESSEIEKRFRNNDRQIQETNNRMTDIIRLTDSNQGEIQRHSRKFGEMDMRIEQLTEQISDIRVLDEVTQVVPAAENWQERRKKRSESDEEQRIGNFQGSMKRHRSTARSGLSAWNVDESDAGSCRSLDGVPDARCMNDRTSGDRNKLPRVNFNMRCLSDEQLDSTHSLNDNENANDQTPPNEINLVAQLVSQLTKQKHVIALPVFDGINVELSSYKRQCLIIAKQNGWTSQDLAVQIISSLQGDARSLMSLLPQGEECNLDSVWEVLKSRFDRTVSVEMAKNQLNTLQQKKNESFLHLQLEVERLINRAYPLANDEMRSQLALDQFVKSINSSGVRYEVRLKSPKDLAQARHMAEEIAIIQASEKYQRLTYVNQIMMTDKDGSSDTESGEESNEKRKKRKRRKVTHMDTGIKSNETQQLKNKDWGQQRQVTSTESHWQHRNPAPQRGGQGCTNQYAPRGFQYERGSRPMYGGGNGGRFPNLQGDQREMDGDRNDRRYSNEGARNQNNSCNQRGRGNFNRGRGETNQRWFHRQRLQGLMEAEDSRSPVKGGRRQ
jgi:hypothetical protein